MEDGKIVLWFHTHDSNIQLTYHGLSPIKKNPLKQILSTDSVLLESETTKNNYRAVPQAYFLNILVSNIDLRNRHTYI